MQAFKRNVCWPGLLLVGAVSAAAAQSMERPATEANPSFYADRRARKTGDILTVLVAESASVTAAARTRTNKDESASASLMPRINDTRAVGADFESDFSGGGQIERSGELFARLSVVVEGLDEAGNLLVRGTQAIVVNNEDQTIRLRGIVRPEDIGPDNTVPSWRVGAARIELTGDGVLARRQSPGWISRLLSMFGQ